MADFETMLRETLGEASAGAPAPVGLVEGARSRLRRRRRTTGAVVAAALVAAAVPVGVALASGGSDRAVTPPATSEPPAVDVPAGWRTETWRDLEVQVPDDWGYGTLDQWCADSVGREGSPRVQRVGGFQTAVGCDPVNGFGLQFFDPDIDSPLWAEAPGAVWRYRRGDVQTYPAGAWLGYERQGAAGVLVAAPDRDTAQRILDSAHRVDVFDANGCAPHPEGMVGATVPGEGFLSICRYGTDGWLEQSERLSAADSLAAERALTSSTVPDRAGPCRTTPELGERVLVSGEGRVWRVEFGGCRAADGVYEGGKHWRLTKDIMFWVLSPGWSGAWDGRHVPMPDHFRG
ncbi:MAG: hypothetical protein U0R80_03700 [Nocardioidaceae bacterium]